MSGQDFTASGSTQPLSWQKRAPANLGVLDCQRRHLQSLQATSNPSHNRYVSAAITASPPAHQTRCRCDPGEFCAQNPASPGRKTDFSSSCATDDSDDKSKTPDQPPTWVRSTARSRVPVRSSRRPPRYDNTRSLEGRSSKSAGRRHPPGRDQHHIAPSRATIAPSQPSLQDAGS